MIHGSLRGFWCDVLSICLLDVGSWYDLSAVPQCAPERFFFYGSPQAFASGRSCRVLLQRLRTLIVLPCKLPL